MGDDIVQLAGDAGSLLGHRLACLGRVLPFELRSTVRRLVDAVTLPQAIPLSS